MYYSTLLVTLALGYPCFAQYELKWNFDSTNMFDEFDFITVSLSPSRLIRFDLESWSTKRCN